MKNFYTSSVISIRENITKKKRYSVVNKKLYVLQTKQLEQWTLYLNNNTE